MDCPEYVYVFGYSPNNDTVYGVYATEDSVEIARVELGRRFSSGEPLGWVEKVPLRWDGSLPTEPFIR